MSYRRELARVATICFCVFSSCFTVWAQEIELAVNDPRPIAEAVASLGKRYGWVVNYEDRRYAQQDLVDVTEQVAKRSLAHRILIPKVEKLSIALPKSEPEAAETIKRLVENYNVSHGAKIFEAVAGWRSIDILPTMTRNSAGGFERTNPIMNTPVTLVSKRRSIAEFVVELCAQISKNSATRFGFGAGPSNLLGQAHVNFGVANLPARLALSKAFETMEGSWPKAEAPKLRWDVFSGPGEPEYMLNILLVR